MQNGIELLKESGRLYEILLGPSSAKDRTSRSLIDPSSDPSSNLNPASFTLPHAHELKIYSKKHSFGVIKHQPSIGTGFVAIIRLSSNPTLAKEPPPMAYQIILQDLKYATCLSRRIRNAILIFEPRRGLCDNAHSSFVSARVIE
jgi:hypothetical protein